MLDGQSRKIHKITDGQFAIRAPAKLNIRLKVTGRRLDGYHELISIMVPVGLCDHIELKTKRLRRVSVVCRGRSLPCKQENLVYKAAKAFLSKTGFDGGIAIKLTKNIPVAAGLGGGSSDAACTLVALNEMCSRCLEFKELKELALRLGADVPFFLYNGPCIAKGIGEILQPIENWPRFWYVIVTPPIEVSTAWVYGKLKLELTKKQDNSIINLFEKKPLELAEILENDLETVTAFHFPVIKRIKKCLIDMGAEGALMSGSGPSVFGMFFSKDQACSAKKHLISQNLGDVFAVGGMPQD